MAGVDGGSCCAPMISRTLAPAPFSGEEGAEGGGGGNRTDTLCAFAKDVISSVVSQA
jgi:hypothetical protein